MTANWLRRPQVLIAAGVFVLTLAVYSATLNSTTPFWDAGEFITTAHIVGVPHQPGTPLYVLMGRVFDVLLSGQPDITQASYRTAWAVNFMSAFFSALAVTFIYLLIWELARRADPDSGWLAHVGGVAGALFLAFSETFWSNAIEAEVYGLGAFMLALLAWLAVRWYDERQRAGSDMLLLLMIYLLGLGVGFHLGTLLVYPGIFVLLVLASRRKLAMVDLLLMSGGLALFLLSTTLHNNGLLVVMLIGYLALVGVRAATGHRFALYGSALFFLGLTVHAIMMIRAGASPEPFINQTAPEDFKTLMSVIRREQYPPLNPFTRQAPLGWQFGYYYRFLFEQFYFLGTGSGLLTTISTIVGPIFLALVGVMQGLRRLRPLIFVPLIGYLINGEILTLYLNFTNHEVRERDYFYFAAFMFAAVFIGLGVSALLRYLAGAEGKSAAEVEATGGDWRALAKPVKLKPAVLAAAGVLVLLPLLPLMPGSTKYFEHDNTNNRIAYEYAWNILAGCDQNGILFTNGDNDTFPIWYLQEVEKFRRDVTVVNLSLINLPWYIKQLKHSPENPLAMQRSDAEIDALRHRLYEDPKTGERQFIMIKDYVLHDIVTANQGEKGRQLFFAVTIPQENMQRYYPNLQMEGMTYRLLDKAGPDNLPVTDPQAVLQNMLGVYKLGSVMQTDDAARSSVYRAMAGLSTDGPSRGLGQSSRELRASDLDSLARMIGSPRTDQYRVPNATFLLGNYPAALNRAGYEFYLQATEAAATDQARYKDLLASALAAFRASLAIAPFNDQALEFFPLLLVQAYRDDEAKTFLGSLQGNVPVEIEERTVFNSIRGFVRGGVPELAVQWLAERLSAQPERKFYYQVLFSVHQAVGDVAQARSVMEAWQKQSGEQDADMARGIEEMRKQSGTREQEQIKQQVEESLGR
ncbi:MAG: DUF2723 domain-containing protein [bacterium]|nr:DUF2723 domain-containing protein [bacterium]